MREDFLKQMRAINNRVLTPENTVVMFRGVQLSDMSKEELHEVLIWFGQAYTNVSKDISEMKKERLLK